jgi:hypothetical protein
LHSWSFFLDIWTSIGRGIQIFEVVGSRRLDLYLYLPVVNVTFLFHRDHDTSDDSARATLALVSSSGQ